MELTLDQALQKGIEAHKAGKAQEADQYYTAILKANPKHPDANHNMGVLAVGVSKVEAALPFFKAALEANSNIAQYWLSYIDALIKLNRLADAKALLDQAKSKGVTEDVLDQIEKRLRLTPSKNLNTQEPTQEELQSLINIYTQGQYQQASIQASQLLKKFSTSVTLYNILGAANQGLGNLAEAIEAYDKAITIKPDFAEAYYNVGNAFKEQGKLDKAIEAYNKAITIKPDFAEAHNNMGIALRDQDKSEEAIEAFNKALSIRPNYAEAYYNAGNSLIEQEKIGNAIQAYTKAVSLKPDYAEAFNNLGNALIEQDNIESAIQAYTKALSIKPDYVDAFNNLGSAFKKQGNIENAIQAYTKALSIKPDYDDAYYNIGNALKDVSFKGYNSSVEKTIIAILDRKTIVKPTDIARAIVSLLKCNTALKAFCSEKVRKWPSQSFDEIILVLAKTPLFLKIMSVCPLPDLDLERGLSSVRSYFLLNISEIASTFSVLKVQSAIALQCFTNEYIYDLTYNDAQALENLERSVQETLSNGEQPNPKFILCLASFQALHKYDWSHSIKNNPTIDEVFKRQILEPREEYKLKSQILTLGEITDKVSTKVREQYEENPYPRWVNLGLRHKGASISEITKEINLKLTSVEIKSVEDPHILIAGCGTGQHSIGTASRFKNSKVLAVDLSLSSLAYAMRKTLDLGIQNIKYMQADILKLHKLDQQFDIVESSGVLHHLENPITGWKVLVDCLKMGGLMKIALYSDLARQPIVKYRSAISQSDLTPSECNIRTLRSQIKNTDDTFSQQIPYWSDFYSMSELRDLIFHVQEHRFNLTQLKNCLDSLGLKFCGFEGNHVMKAFKLTNPDKEALYDLDEWAKFEKVNPSAFVGMYQFWCQKVE